MIDEQKLERVKKALWAEVNRYVAKTEEGKSGFVLDEHNVPVMRDLAHWIIGAPCKWLQPGMGIGIAGPVGTFKTEMMNALSRTIVRGGGKGFASFSMLAVEKEYSRSSKDDAQNGGAKVILKYGRMEQDVCFHDIGEEPTGQHFGVTCDVFGEIMSMRYELYKQRGVLTHGTSNIVSEEGLLQKYDARTASRLLEQLRWMPLGGPDRRRDALPVQRTAVELFAPEPPMPTEEELEASRERAKEGFRRIHEVIANAAKEVSVEPSAPTKPQSTSDTTNDPQTEGKQASTITRGSDLMRFAELLIEKDLPELHKLRSDLVEQNKYQPEAARPFLELLDGEVKAREVEHINTPAA